METETESKKQLGLVIKVGGILVGGLFWALVLTNANRCQTPEPTAAEEPAIRHQDKREDAQPAPHPRRGTGTSTGPSNTGPEQPEAVAASAAVSSDLPKPLPVRKYQVYTAEAVFGALADLDDPQETWETQYEGRYVEWTAKFERPALTVKFVASTGPRTAVSCYGYDDDRFQGIEDRIKRWSGIRVSGKLRGYQPQFGKNKTEFVLSECRVDVISGPSQE